MQQQTETRPHLKRNVLIAVAVLAVAAAIIFLVKALGAPAPVDYKITVQGNISATWYSPDGTGKIDIATGAGTQTISASEITVTVTSTMPSGAACRIVDPSVTVVDEQSQLPSAAAPAEGAWTTVTCSAPKS